MYLTGPVRLHQPVPVLWRLLLGLPCLSVEIVNTALSIDNSSYARALVLALVLQTYLLRFQLLLQHGLPLMQPAEPVNLLLVFATDFILFSAADALFVS